MRFAAFVCALLVATSAEAGVRHVVLLQSFERGNLILDRFTSLLRVELDESSDEPVNFTEFVVTPAGFVDAPSEAFITFLQSAFAGRPRPDLVITAGGPAAAFAWQHRDELFPDSPILYAAVDQRAVKGRDLSAREAVVAVASDVNGLVEGILQLFPATNNLFVVVGAGPQGRFWRPEMQSEAGRFADRLRFTWSDGMSYAEMLEHVSSLPPQSAIFFVSMDLDSQGAAYSTDRVLTDLRARAKVPLFGSQSAELGYGVIGGNVISIEDVVHRSSAAALEMLGGVSPASIKTSIQQPGPPVFDWRELRRWNIDERDLPAGSIVRYREAGLWERFKWPIIGTLSGTVAQSLLIGALLFNRSKRRRAEELLRQNVADLDQARSALSKLNGRLMDAQEQERSRVARELHDDICQRTAALSIDIGLLTRRFADDDTEAIAQVRKLCEETQTLAGDINHISHQLHSSKLESLGLAAAAKAFCREMSVRHDVVIDFSADAAPPTLPAGVAASLFRVLQEALSNAIRHSGSSRYHVTVRGSADRVQLEVRDHGRGFDPQALSVSGLGLISMRERLRFMNGTLAIDSGPRTGTTVTATVPLATPH